MRPRSDPAWRRLAPALPALLVLTLAGCGGSGKSSTASHAASSASTQASPRSPQAIARDRALGTAGLLRLSDLPSGWIATERKKKKSQPRLSGEVASCLHVSVSQLGGHEPEEVQSPRFRSSRGETISNSVTVKPTADDAAKEFAILAKPQTPACLTSAFAKLLSSELKRHGRAANLPAGFSLGAPTVQRVPFDPVGDQSLVYRVAIPLITPVGRVKTYFDIVAVRAGRADVSFSFSGSLAPIAAGTERELTLVSIHRLQAAGGVAAKTSPA